MARLTSSSPQIKLLDIFSSRPVRKGAGCGFPRSPRPSAGNSEFLYSAAPSVRTNADLIDFVSFQDFCSLIRGQMQPGHNCVKMPAVLHGPFPFQILVQGRPLNPASFASSTMLCLRCSTKYDNFFDNTDIRNTSYFMIT